MEDIIIIIPVHEYDASVKDMLEGAVSSVENQHICISTTKEIAKEIKKDFKQPFLFCTSSKNTSFQALVNSAVNFLKKEKYQWFSILEFDDTYTPIWFKNVNAYYKSNPEVSIFLPINHLVRISKDNEITFFGYGNEAPWASTFSNEIGFVDYDVLSVYSNFYLTGAVISVDDFINVGGLKESMKVSFWYEFLLRLTNKEKKVYVVPKIGYIHLVDRENSLFDIYNKTLTEKEIKWWYELAKEECNFIKDRNKTYKEEEEEEN